MRPARQGRESFSGQHVVQLCPTVLGGTHSLDILDDDKLKLVVAVALRLVQVGEVLSLLLTPDRATDAEAVLEKLLGAVYARPMRMIRYIRRCSDRPRVRGSRVGEIKMWSARRARREWRGIMMTSNGSQYQYRTGRGGGLAMLTGTEEAARARDQDEGTLLDGRHRVL